MALGVFAEEKSDHLATKKLVEHADAVTYIGWGAERFYCLICGKYYRYGDIN